MKTYFVFPDYWEKCAGDEPCTIVQAHTEFEAIQLATPLPWNCTFGARAIEAKRCHLCGAAVLTLTQGECANCYIPPFVEPELPDDPEDWSHLT